VDIPDGMSIPEELARRKARLRKLAAARAKIEARAKERFQRDQADHEAKLAARDAKAAAGGKKPRGRPPQPPVGPLPMDHGNVAPDLPPQPGSHASFARDHEYKRHGTLSLLAGIDLLIGQVHACIDPSSVRPRETVVLNGSSEL
jgi:hypothetical protein